MNEKRLLKFRTSTVPTVPLPAGLRSTGHYVLPAGKAEQNPPRRFTQFFWCAAGSGAFAHQGRSMRARAGQCFYYLPYEPHHIHSATGWEYYWFTLDGPLAVDIISAYGWPRQPFQAGPCPVELFRQLQVEINDISPAGQRRAAGTAYRILSSVGARQKTADDDSLVERARQYIQAHIADTGLNVSVLAQHLGVHRATLSRQFHAATGTTCIEYLTAVRLQQALALLRDTADPVGDIARQCGFSDPNYFSKAVAKATGYAPLGFRRL